MRYRRRREIGEAPTGCADMLRPSEKTLKNLKRWGLIYIIISFFLSWQIAVVSLFFGSFIVFLWFFAYCILAIVCG